MQNFAIGVRIPVLRMQNEMWKGFNRSLEIILLSISKKKYIPHNVYIKYITQK